MIPEKILKSKILTQLPKILFDKANKLKIRIKLLYLVKKNNLRTKCKFRSAKNRDYLISIK